MAAFYHNLGSMGPISPKAANVQSLRAALKALEFDDKLAEAHAMMAMLRACMFDWKGAEREFLRALELGLESPEVGSNYGLYYLLPMRRLDEAVAASRRAVELDPLSPAMQWRLGHGYFMSRQWDLTIEQCRNALELDPNYFLAHIQLGLAHVGKGEFEDAITACERGAQLAGRSPWALGILGHLYGLAGRTGEAQKVARELRDRTQTAYVSPWSFALIEFALGKIDRGFDLLEKAGEECELQLLLIPCPAYDWLHSHPRYPALLRKMNLEP